MEYKSYMCVGGPKDGQVLSARAGIPVVCVRFKNPGYIGINLEDVINYDQLRNIKTVEEVTYSVYTIGYDPDGTPIEILLCDDDSGVSPIRRLVDGYYSQP